MTRTSETAAAVAMEEDFDKKYEFVDGKWQAREMGSLRHSGVGTRLIARLCTYVEANELGAVYGADTTFVIGSNDRLPDVSFLSAARIPVDGETDKKWFLAPDLAIEVISPNDVWEQVNRKVREYFAAGVRQVWLISLEQQTVHVYDSPTRVAILTEEQDLANDELLPGFRCRIGDLFKQPARS